MTVLDASVTPGVTLSLTTYSYGDDYQESVPGLKLNYTTEDAARAQLPRRRRTRSDDLLLPERQRRAVYLHLQGRTHRGSLAL